eukprot:765580-Hanusia_phi.AAC.3
MAPLSGAVGRRMAMLAGASGALLLCLLVYTSSSSSFSLLERNLPGSAGWLPSQWENGGWVRWNHAQDASGDGRRIFYRVMDSLEPPSRQPLIKNFSPEDHVKVKANAWLVRPGDRDALAKEAKEVLGSYDADGRGKVISWEDFARFQHSPGLVEGSEAGRKKLEEFQADPQVAKELERYRQMFGDGADRTTPLERVEGYSPAVEKIVSEYFDRMRKQQGVKQGSDGVENGVNEDGEPYIKIKFNRKIRNLPPSPSDPAEDEESSDDLSPEAEDSREARIERVAREEARMKEAREAERRRRESQEVIQGAISPIQDEIQEVKQMIQKQQKNIDDLSKDVHEQREDKAESGPVNSGSGFLSNSGISFSIPGKIKMDRLELPGGRYDFAIGGPGVGREDGEKAMDQEPVVYSRPPLGGDKDVKVEQDEDKDGGVLNSREDLDAGIDQEAVKEAARDLANSRIQSFDDSQQGAREDDVLDSVSMMDNAIDRAAVKAAADELRDEVIKAHQSSGKAGGDDVLDSTTGMDNGVDLKAVREAAEQLQSRKIGESRSSNDDDVLDSRSMMDNAIDRKAVEDAAKELQNRVISAAAPSADDVLDSSTGMDNGVDVKAVRQAAEELQAKLAGGKVIQPQTSGLRVKDAKLASARTQMLSEEMLLPIDMEGGFSGKYLDPVGGTAYRNEQRSRASIEETEADRNHTEHLKSLMDEEEEQPLHEYQPSSAGGLGAAGSSQEAWYSSWWRNPNAEDVINSVDEDLGLNGDNGKEKLVENGLNVDGWEPGRSQEQVKKDELEHHEVPAGFWSADMQENQDYDEDSEGDKAEGQEEDENSGSEERAEGGESQEEEKEEEKKEEEPLWKDPMPKSVLCQGRNATWCQEEAAEEGQEQQQQQQQE